MLLVIKSTQRLAAIKLQERVRKAAYPNAKVAWYVHPPVIAGADYSAIDKFLEGSLIRRTYNTEAIYVRQAARCSNSSGALDLMIFLNLNARQLDLMFLSGLNFAQMKQRWHHVVRQPLIMHDSDWEVAAHIGRYKRNLMGSSRTNEIEIPHVQVGTESYKLQRNCQGLCTVVNFISEGDSNKIPDKCELSHNVLLLPPFLTLLFMNYYGSLVITISHREKSRLGLFEWSSRRHRRLRPPSSTAVSLPPVLGHL